MCDKDEVEAARHKDLLPGRLDCVSQLLNLMALVMGWCEDKELHPPICRLDIAIKSLREQIESNDVSDDSEKQSFILEQLKLSRMSK